MLILSAPVLCSKGIVWLEPLGKCWIWCYIHLEALCVLQSGSDKSIRGKSYIFLFSPGCLTPTPFNQPSLFLQITTVCIKKSSCPQSSFGRFQTVALNEGCFCSLRVFGKVFDIFGCCGAYSCHLLRVEAGEVMTYPPHSMQDSHPQFQKMACSQVSIVPRLRKLFRD